MVGWPKEAEFDFDIQVGNRNNPKDMPSQVVDIIFISIYDVYIYIYIWSPPKIYIYIWHICILRLDIRFIYIYILYIPQVCFVYIPCIPTPGFESAAHTNSNCPIIQWKNGTVRNMVAASKEVHRSSNIVPKSQHPLVLSNWLGMKPMSAPGGGNPRIAPAKPCSPKVQPLMRIGGPKLRLFRFRFAYNKNLSDPYNC